MGYYCQNRDMTLESNQPSPNRRKSRLLSGAKTRAGGCCLHGGKSTGPKTQAGHARIAEARACAGAPIERGFERVG